MKLRDWIDQATPLPGAPGTRQLHVTAEAWLSCAKDVSESGGRLAALWADCAGQTTVFAALVAELASKTF